MKLAQGQIHPKGKLNDQIQREFCNYIANQMTVADACELCSLNRTTVWEWRALGQNEPTSRYGQFEAAVKKALATAKAFLVAGVAQHPDIRGKMFLLKNRYPLEFRDHIVQEMTGADGGPIAVNLNPFVVNVNLSGDVGMEFVTVDHRGEDSKLAKAAKAGNF